MVLCIRRMGRDWEGILRSQSHRAHTVQSELLLSALAAAMTIVGLAWSVSAAAAAAGVICAVASLL